VHRFEVMLSPKAVKDLDSIDDKPCSKIISAIRALEANPFPRAKLIKKIKGRQNDYYRLRADKHRVLYMIEGDKVIVLRVFSKKDADRIIRGLD
jgi:mRNA-degrading endonuclease RelE of RelBE toxin-antitoxin system